MNVCMFHWHVALFGVGLCGCSEKSRMRAGTVSVLVAGTLEGPM